MNIKKLLILLAMTPVSLMAWHSIKLPNIKSLQVITNNDFEALPIIQLGSNDQMAISFDELSHNYRRFTYRVEPCNPDWTPTEGLFDADWLEGINDQPIEQYKVSLRSEYVVNWNPLKTILMWQRA